MSSFYKYISTVPKPSIIRYTIKDMKMFYQLEKHTEALNTLTSYFLIMFLWAPHGARECIEICNGPYFISPMISTFLMPNWTMDMSWGGWCLQALFSTPLLFLYFILRKIQHKKYGSLLKIYVIRWTIMWAGILMYYNLIFWSPFRDYLMPLFSFTNP